MNDIKQIVLRDLVLESLEIETGDKICLWIHDTEDKNLTGYSYAEFGDFLKAAFVAEFTAGCFKIDQYEYVEGEEKIGYYQACIMKLIGTVIDGPKLINLLKEVACLAIRDFSKYPNSEQLSIDSEEIWSNDVLGLDYYLSKKDLWLEPDCPMPELYKAVRLRNLLYHGFFADDEDSVEIAKELKRIAPDFPEEVYFEGPNISY